MSACILVDQHDITQLQMGTQTVRDLQQGEVRLTLQSFALTANNVTYAATGKFLKYWEFFPSGVAGKGIVPVWGTAVVSESLSEALKVGQAVYGFLPMGAELVIHPKQVSARVFADETAHRKGLPGVYNRYIALPNVRENNEDFLRALLQPLIATSYLLFDWLLDNDCFGATQIVVGSASSKTGLGLCKFLAEPEGRDYRIVGLTSAGNLGFVTGLNACDQVVTYDAVDTLEQVPTVYVDMAGDAEVKLRLHNHLGDNMKYSAAVGTSHWDKFAEPVPMPGAKPKFFFAPAQIAKRREEWGPGVIEGRIEAATLRVAAESGDWLTLKVHQGLAAVPAIYADLAQGRAVPDEGHVFQL